VADDCESLGGDDKNKLMNNLMNVNRINSAPGIFQGSERLEIAKSFNSGIEHGENHHNCSGHGGDPVHRGNLADRVARLEESELIIGSRLNKVENDIVKLNQDMQDLEARFMDQVNELVKVMAKRFADRAKNKAEHAEFEKQIRNLYDLIMGLSNKA